jgi:hypothetical protein
MSVEKPFFSTHHPSRLATKSEKELFTDVKEAKHNGVQLDLVDYLGAFLKSGNIILKTEAQSPVDPNKLLIIASNHHSRSKRFTTRESLRTVGIVSVSARKAGVSPSHIAWLIKELEIPAIGIGKMPREVQNATIDVFGSIPARFKSSIERAGIFPKFVSKPINAAEVNEKIGLNFEAGNNIGIFPEQEPSFKLLQHHPSYPAVLGLARRHAQLQGKELEMATLAVFYEDNVAHAAWGPRFDIKPNCDLGTIAAESMLGIASKMPQKLRGYYA